MQMFTRLPLESVGGGGGGGGLSISVHTLTAVHLLQGMVYFVVIFGDIQMHLSYSDATGLVVFH